MCYAIPGKIQSIDGKTVQVSYFGELRKAYNELHEIAVGDYVYAQGGFIITKVSPGEAEATLSIWKEEFFELQKVDLRISKVNVERSGIDKRLVTILDKASMGQGLGRDDYRYLLGLNDAAALDYLFKTANFLRQKNHGNSCCVHAIIEISNYCKKQCSYCGISALNAGLKRYRMSPEEIIDTAGQAVSDFGFKALVLQSGEDAGYDIRDLEYVIRTIKTKWPSLIFISFGEIGTANLERLYNAGARGLLMRFETSNPAIYRALHPGQGLDARIEHLKAAYKMGYLILTGGLIGLPGQTNEDIVGDILLAQELNAEMFSFGPFIPHFDTPLNANKPADEEMVLKALALSRIIDQKKAKILVTTALETLNPALRKKALASGGNSVMLNMTPLEYRSLYSIYPNRAHEKELIQTQINDTIALLRSLGRAPTDLSI
ncbi:MAG: HypC/HybG/HupF family hydrogenase formation chaperone [Candidatus Omnitrophica bacterium]|nr:HypC/HybG/HupF family hydrogenase formation chaperone [Candidatus Omnitrophota bacterium]